MYFVFLVFFFKQKTAYEMRISDWSSDVCSSDLTHVDAPWHYHSTSEGRRAATIDEAPLDLFMRPGVKLDFRAKPDGHVVSAAEVQREFARIGYQLQTFDIVLVNKSAGAAYGSDDFLKIERASCRERVCQSV